MAESDNFRLFPSLHPWLGGEPRVFAVDKEDEFPKGLSSIEAAHVVDVSYEDGGLTALMDRIAAACQTRSGSFQAFLENLEDLSHERPLIVIVRHADRLLADVGPALIHFITGWERFTHHANGISAIYLILETGPRAITQSAFYPGGFVDWVRK